MNNIQPVKRIFITGNAGSGKTTLSLKLNEILQIPVKSLDEIVWKPKWEAAPLEERINLIYEIIKPDEWIIDGVSTDVLKVADTIIFLDFPRRTIFWRLCKRNWKYLFRSRPGLPQQCPEILIIKKLITIAWNFTTQVRPNIIRYINEINTIKNVFHIKSNSELEKFLGLIKDKSKNKMNAHSENS